MNIMVIGEKEYPYFATTYEPHYEVTAWCEEHFGEFGNRWYRLGYDPLAIGSPDQYVFTNQDDCAWFSLRWA